MHYLQCKLILEPDGFTSRDTFFDFGDLVAKVAKGFGVGWDGRSGLHGPGYWGSPSRTREVTFWDTPDFALRKHNFILRRRIAYQDGFPVPHSDVCLKYRVPNMELAKSVDMTPNLSDFRIKFKAEAIPAREGNTRLIYSHNVQTSMAAIPCGIGSMDALRQTFPVLAGLSIARPVTLVNNLIVEEVLQDLGTLDFGHGDTADANIAIWRDRGTHRPLCAEFAFEFKVQHMHDLKEKALERSERFFIAMQAHSKLMPGVTKTELVYKGA